MADPDELARAIERGEYSVDPHAVAEAMIRSMLESGKPFDLPPVGVEQDEPAPDADVA
jgi:hypothetical protein